MCVCVYGVCCGACVTRKTGKLNFFCVCYNNKTGEVVVFLISWTQFDII